MRLGEKRGWGYMRDVTRATVISVANACWSQPQARNRDVNTEIMHQSCGSSPTLFLSVVCSTHMSYSAGSVPVTGDRHSHSPLESSTRPLSPIGGQTLRLFLPLASVAAGVTSSSHPNSFGPAGPQGFELGRRREVGALGGKWPPWLLDCSFRV